MKYYEALRKVEYGMFATRPKLGGSIFYVAQSEFIVLEHPLDSVFPIGTKVKYSPHIALISKDNTVRHWTPNAHDQLADDWTCAVAPRYL